MEQAAALLAVLAVEVCAVVQQQEDYLDIAVLHCHVQAGVLLGVSGVGIASALQEQLGELVVRVVDCPPHRVCPFAHYAVIDLSTGHHYSAAFEQRVLVGLHHLHELAESDFAVPGVLVLELVG